MLVALGSFTVLGESLSAAAWLGVCAVTAGVLMVGLSRPVEALHHRRALAFALANAFVIAGYTFVDGQGADQFTSGAPPVTEMVASESRRLPRGPVVGPPALPGTPS